MWYNPQTDVNGQEYGTCGKIIRNSELFLCHPVERAADVDELCLGGGPGVQDGPVPDPVLVRIQQATYSSNVEWNEVVEVDQ